MLIVLVPAIFVTISFAWALGIRQGRRIERSQPRHDIHVLEDGWPTAAIEPRGETRIICGTCGTHNPQGPTCSGCGKTFTARVMYRGRLG